MNVLHLKYFSCQFWWQGVDQFINIRRACVSVYEREEGKAAKTNVRSRILRVDEWRGGWSGKDRSHRVKGMLVNGF